MARTLTSAFIRTLRPGPERIEIKDGAATALYLCLQPSGHRSFVMRFRAQSGKLAKLTLGTFDPGGEAEGEPVLGAPLTLAAARRLTAELLRDRARGRDIIADQKASKAQKQIRHEANFPQAVRDFVEQHARPKTRGWVGTSRLLGVGADGEVIPGGLADIWADKVVDDIDGGMIYTVVESAKRRGLPGLAANGKPSEARSRHLFSALSVLFSWLHRHRRVTANPCLSVHRPEAGRSRDRVLSTDELRLYWKAADAEPLYGPLLKILLLTGTRLREVSGMRRSELADGLSAWTIPAQRSKNGRACTVPLPGLARQLIEDVLNTGDLVFSTNGRTPVSGWSKLKKRLDLAMDDTPPWVLHDVRRSVATGMAENATPPHIVEAILNHVSGAKAGVAGTYNRAAYAAEKKIALERWAAHVASVVSLVEGRGVVVPLRA